MSELVGNRVRFASYLSSAVSTQKKQNLVLSQLTISKVYFFTDKYAWREFEYKKGTV
ncbi:MAG: hypothetical protein V7K38_17195 [Nostoc sp.]|uniref:hypothetical protein n=1 Tax=Nostoc sp. TaxID=1180 RepID=UPI002FF69821